VSGEDPCSIARFAMDRQVDLTPCKYPYFCDTMNADHVVGLGSKALGVVAILPLSRGAFFSAAMLCANVFRI
jgi:hypothetical protein